MKTPLISENLQNDGYTAGAFLTAPFLTAANGYSRGFEQFWTGYNHDQWNLPHIIEYGWEIATNNHYSSGKTVTRKLTEFIANTDDPFFAWGHYTDVHAPYNRYSRHRYGEKRSPRYIQRLFRLAKYRPRSITDVERQILIDAYDNSIRELDRWIRQLWMFLRLEGHLEDTIVILTADHGEQFGENGRYEHRRVLDDALLRTPLIVRDPYREPRIDSSKVASVDVAATICGYAGVEASQVRGQPLFDDLDRQITTSCVKRGKRLNRVV